MKEKKKRIPRLPSFNIPGSDGERLKSLPARIRAADEQQKVINEMLSNFWSWRISQR